MLALAAAMTFLVRQFVGMIVLGVFGYYATRPIAVRVRRVVDSRRTAAVVTVLTILVPILLLLVLAAAQLFHHASQLSDGGTGGVIAGIVGFEALSPEQRGQLVAFVRDPTAAIDVEESLSSNLTELVSGVQGAFGGIVLIALSTTLSYVLLAYDRGIADTGVRLVGGRDTTARAYAAAVDADLESVFFGNLLFAVVMAVLATATYSATNLLAPEGIAIPMVFVLGMLTGAASLIPIVVGKVVYLPVVAVLAVQALQDGGAGLVFVGAVLVAYVLLLDLLPQSIVQPYVTGQRIEPVILLFAYLVGPIAFGWYGFFLMPVLFVLVIEAVRIVLPELVRGEPIEPEATVAEGLGTDPAAATEPRTATGHTPDDPGIAADDRGSDGGGSDADTGPADRDGGSANYEGRRTDHDGGPADDGEPTAE